MNRRRRVLFIAGYTRPAEHRKVELLADAEDVEIRHLLGPTGGRASGIYPSANGQRSYSIHVGGRTLGRPDDPHRAFGWPPDYGLTSFKPDLIHYEGELESLGAAEVVVLRWLLAHRAKLILNAWQNILRPRRRLVRLIIGMNLAGADQVLCASEEASTVLRRQGYQGRTSVLPIMGVDTRTFYPRGASPLRRELGLDGFVVGYAGRLVPEKGIDTLLQAAARIAPMPTVLLLGDGPEKPRLEQLAAELGLGQRYRVVTGLPHEAMPDYLNALDTLVLPSRTMPLWKEQLGRVLLEAMACAVPVVGSDSGAIPEVIGDTGRIFPEGNVAALAEILQELAVFSERRADLGARGYRRAIATYAVDVLAMQTLATWRELWT